MKQCACSDRSLVAAPTAPVETALHLPCLLGSAFRTNKPVRPAQRGDVLFASLLRGKSLAKLNDGLRVVWRLHGAIVQVKSPRVNCIALLGYSLLNDFVESLGLEDDVYQESADGALCTEIATLF